MAGEVKVGELTHNLLPFDLPDHLAGCEQLIIDWAHREAARLAMHGGVSYPDMDSLYRCAASEVDDRVRSYWALGQMATNPNSLAYQLYNGEPKPEPWTPWAAEAA